MEKSDYDEFVKVLKLTAEVYKENLSGERIALYFNALFSLDLMAIRYAMNKHVTSSVFFPKPAEIIRLAEEMPQMRLQHSGNPTLKALSESVPSRPEVVKKAMGILNAVVSGGMTMEEALKEIPVPEK